MTARDLTTADGLRIRLRDDGRGAELILLHGFAGSGAEWDPFLPALVRLTRVLRPDLLGHGGSARPADPARHAVERQAADLAALLRAEGIASLHLVGYSFGARIALRLALDAPELVRSLFLESPSAGIADPAARAERRAADAALAELLEREGIGPFADRWEALPIFAGEDALPPEERDRRRAALRANDPAGLAASLRGAGQGAMDPLHDRLGTLALPVTVLAGERDAAGVERAQAVAAAIPGARLVIVPGASHAVHRTDPDRFRRELATHLVHAMEVCSADSCAVRVPDLRPLAADPVTTPASTRSPA